MTSKERASFRAAANSLTASFQIGKSGFTQAVVAQTEVVLDAKELMKIKVLKSCPQTARELADMLQEATGADVISVVGGTIVLYRYSEPLHEKQAKKEANKRAAAKAASNNHYGGRYDKELKWKR